MIPLPFLSQPFAPLFCCPCHTSSSVSRVSVKSPIFLLLCMMSWEFFQKCSGIHACSNQVATKLKQNSEIELSIRALKQNRQTLTTCTVLTFLSVHYAAWALFALSKTNRTPYMENPLFNSLVWGSLRLTPITYIIMIMCMWEYAYARCLCVNLTVDCWLTNVCVHVWSHRLWVLDSLA